MIGLVIRALALVVPETIRPYPAQHQGTGREKTLGSAVVDYEIGKSCCPSGTDGNVNVCVFERAGITCPKLETAKSSRFFSYTVETDGKRLTVGRPPSSAFFEQASFNITGLTTGFQTGARTPAASTAGGA